MRIRSSPSICATIKKRPEVETPIVMYRSSWSEWSGSYIVILSLLLKIVAASPKATWCFWRFVFCFVKIPLELDHGSYVLTLIFFNTYNLLNSDDECQNIFMVWLDTVGLQITCYDLHSKNVPCYFSYGLGIPWIQWDKDLIKIGFTPTAESHGFSPDILWSGLWSGCRSTKSRRSPSETAKLSGAKGLPVGLHNGAVPNRLKVIKESRWAAKWV